MKKRTYLKRNVYLTAPEYERVRQKLSGTGVSFSAFARDLLTGKDLTNPKAIPVDQFRELSALGNNLNQLTRVANSQRHVPENLSALLSQLRDSLQSIAEALR